jgi:transposase-like protein
VARRNGVTRQTVYVWLKLYAAKGPRGLVDRTSRSQWCPHQMDPVTEARIVAAQRSP